MSAEHPVLEVRQIEVLYGQAILAVQEVSLTVGEGQIVAFWAPTAQARAPP
jgi:ABC-type branched-subunit amino acid transport system ATPase component